MVRPFADDDLRAVLDVWARASQVAHSFLTEAFLERERRDIVEIWMPLAETTVYEVDGHVVGFISMIGNEVGAIFVDPDHQSRGIGSALMDHARESRPFVEVDVFEANAIGRAFYAGYGFEPVGRRIDDDIGHPILRLRLNDPTADA